MDPEQPLPGFIGGNTLIHDLTDEAIERLCRSARRTRRPCSSCGRSAARTTMCRRKTRRSPLAMPPGSRWRGRSTSPDSSTTRPARASRREWDAIEALGEAVYGNFTPSTDSGIAARMYPPATMARLATVKREWDPQNLFCRCHNVRPRLSRVDGGP